MICPAQGSDPADEWVRLGVESQLASNGLAEPHRGGKLAEAQGRYNQALRLDPRHAIALQNLALVFAQSNGFLNEASLTIERATMLDPTKGIIWMNRALIAVESERIDEALAAASKAVEIAPNDVNALWALAIAYQQAGMPDKAVPLYGKMLDIEPKHPVAGLNLCFLSSLADMAPADLLAVRKRWYDAHRYTGAIPKHTNDKNPDRPLRVGYVGGDYKSHSAAFIFRRVLLHHSDQIEMYLYSSLAVDPNSDKSTRWFMDVAGSRWRDIATMSDEDAAALIRKDKIDILVDLAAHTNGGRLALFTRRPAPIQGTAWGFAHGTGLPEIDFFFADPLAITPEERPFYAEKIVDLPCIVTMEAPQEYQLKATSSPPLRKNGYITFGVYCRYEKISDSFLATLAKIMAEVPDARLEFKDNAFRRPYSLRRVMAAMPEVAPERLLFSTATSHTDHMLAYQQCDLALDPWPHGGGAVSLEQLYMGVPLVALCGKQPSGRSAASVLTAIGRGAWVARTQEEYVAIATQLANDPKTLASARLTLRDEFLKSPVIVGYVEAVEAAYRKLWKEWCEA